MASRVNWSAMLPWMWRLFIAAAILAAPIITFWAFTDRETSDPVASSAARRPPEPKSSRPDRPDGLPTIRSHNLRPP